MKQVAQNYRSGELAVLDVPPPTCAPGGVLVRSLFLPDLHRDRADEGQRVEDVAARQGQGPAGAGKEGARHGGPARTGQRVPEGDEPPGLVHPARVLVGRGGRRGRKGAEEFSVGQVVACAGNEFAFHAELNWVPVNLCVPVPDGVAPQFAAFGTVGAIALQGSAKPKCSSATPPASSAWAWSGSWWCSCWWPPARVFGIDVVPDRCRLAEKMGAILGAAPDDDGLAAIEAAIAEASGGFGADRILLVAGGSSNGPAEMAAGSLGTVPPWSTSASASSTCHGARTTRRSWTFASPARTVPVATTSATRSKGSTTRSGYVRWTERRNLACFIDLVAKGDIDLEPLMSGVFPVTEAVDVYERLQTKP